MLVKKVRELRRRRKLRASLDVFPGSRALLVAASIAFALAAAGDIPDVVNALCWCDAPVEIEL